MTDKQIIQSLNKLVRMCRDGEEGFRVAAENVRNRGLKTLFKSYAQQRVLLAQELEEEVKRLGGSPLRGGSVLAGLHRGWIGIKATMTIGAYRTEQVVLGEVQRGERAAVRAYEDVLNQELPPDTRLLVEGQLQKIQDVYDWVDRMQGREGMRLVVRLFDNEQDVQRAIEELYKHGFSDEAISQIAIGSEISIYARDERRQTVGESAGAGALLGLLVGALVGLAIGIGMLLVPGMDLGMEVGFPQTIIAAVIGGIGVGALFGSLIGAIIGQGVVEEDAYLYADSLAHGSILLCVETDSRQAEEASTVMLQVNAARTS